MQTTHDPKQVIIIGAGGHAKVIADIVLQNGDCIIGFLDDGDPHGTFLDRPKLGGSQDFRLYPDCYFIIAIGNARVRERIAEAMTGVKWYTAIHPTACISPIGTSIGEGTAIMANAVVNPGARIGRHCILNTGSVVEHDNVIGDFVHVSVGTTIAGTVSVGERTWVGIGAVISNNLSVCNDCMLGAGTVVIRDITESGTYVGIPSKKIK